MPDSRSAELIFEAARIMSVPAERIAYLDGACGNDVALRRRVERLLAADAVAGSFLEHALDPNAGITGSLPPGEAATAAGRAMSADTAGARIGPYTLVEKIGEGGMGVVWSADQTEPVRRRVALKLIKPGMDTVQVIRRFETERQALALMDHTNIAKVFDAGTTVDRRPFFVMELIHGIPITSHCDQSQLSVRERLALFIPICHAIQHAHQKGIIHRDIKPSNVLVTMQDGVPVPKVIDFGVAKALHQRLTDTEVDTQLGIVVGTFEYMSPEQAKLSALDVDTRADIYALGVLLYELLTGSTPLDRRQLRQAALTECLRIIREVEPSKPSTKLSSSDDLPSIAAKRKLEPARLTRLVSGDLDWIAMKCLEKDRTRRYETANSLLMDVERYLADEPVEACPPSAVYRFKKFVRRNKGPVVAATLLMTAILTGSGVSIWQAVRAERARHEEAEQRANAEREWARAEANYQIIRNLSFQLIDIADTKLAPVRQAELVRRDILNAGLAGFEKLLAQRPNDPDLQKRTAKLMRYTANVHRLLNESAAAMRSYQESIRILQALSASVPTDRIYRIQLCETLRDYAGLLEKLGRLREASELLQQSVDIAKGLKLEAPDRTDHQRPLAWALLELSGIEYGRGLIRAAQASSEQAAEIFRSVISSKVNRHPLDGLMLAWALALQGACQRELGTPIDALKSQAESIVHLKAKLEEGSNQDVTHFLGRAIVEQSKTLVVLRRHEEAARQLDQAILLWQDLVARFPRIAVYREWQAVARRIRAELHIDQNRPIDASNDIEAARAMLEELVAGSPDIPSYGLHLGQTHLAAARLATVRNDKTDAARWYKQALDCLRRARERGSEIDSVRLSIERAEIALHGLTP